MKSLFAVIVAIAAIGASASALPNPDGSAVCTAECRPVKPICPKGEAPSGSEGCWGCCQPEHRVCTTECRPVKPTCPKGEAPTGSESCWGCCQPEAAYLPPTACTTVCRTEKPTCPEGQAPTGKEGCWGCCEPTKASATT